MRTAKWNIIIFKFCSATVGMRNFHFENKCLFLFEEIFRLNKKSLILSILFLTSINCK